jgi:hypothetical protein
MLAGVHVELAGVHVDIIIVCIICKKRYSVLKFLVNQERKSERSIILSCIYIEQAEKLTQIMLANFVLVNFIWKII